MTGFAWSMDCRIASSAASAAAMADEAAQSRKAHTASTDDPSQLPGCDRQVSGDDEDTAAFIRSIFLDFFFDLHADIFTADGKIGQ